MTTGRMIAGGLLAGLVLNIGEALLHGFLFAEQTAAAMAALGKDATGSPVGLSLLLAVTFAQGVIGVWLGAASKQSAVVMGLALWALSGLYSATYFWAGFPGVIPDGVLWGPAACEVVLYPLAMLAGYRVTRSSL